MTTNNQQDDKMRAEFEDHFKYGHIQHIYFDRKPDGSYQHLLADAAWMGWQAALASREQAAQWSVERVAKAIELCTENHHGGYSGWDTEYIDMAKAALAAMRPVDMKPVVRLSEDRAVEIMVQGARLCGSSSNFTNFRNAYRALRKAENGEG